MRRCLAGALALSMAVPLSAASLAQEIARLLDAAPVSRSAFWGIEIVDLASGKTLYSRNSDRLFVPASNAKLFTTALALDRLGPDFRFQTRLLSEAAPDGEGRVHGAVRLVGGGDPNLSARAVPYRIGPTTGDPLAPLEDLASQAVARGVKRIEGGIIVSPTTFATFPWSRPYSTYAKAAGLRRSIGHVSGARGLGIAPSPPRCGSHLLFDPVLRNRHAAAAEVRPFCHSARLDCVDLQFHMA